VVQPSELVLDLDATRTLVARPMTVPDHADPPFRATVALWESGKDARRIPWHYDEVFIAHAALLPRGGLAVIDADGRLMQLDSPMGAPTLVARHATGPIGVSPNGDTITFLYGEMPDFELHEVERSGGSIVAVTRGLAPVWCGAPGRERGSFVFASGSGGEAATWLARSGDLPRRVPSVPFPSGLIAPDVAALGGRDVYVLESEGGIAVIDATGTLVHLVPVGRAPFLQPDGTLEYATSAGWQATMLTVRASTP
jgi:hypothetical protein